MWFYTRKNVLGSIRLWDNRSSNLLRQNNMKHTYLFYGISDSKKNELINLEKVTLRFQCYLVSCLKSIFDNVELKVITVMVCIKL